MAELEARGITVRDVAPADFIAAYASHLKNSDKFEVCEGTKLARLRVQFLRLYLSWF